MKNLFDTKEGVIITIKVTPNARKNEVVGWKDGCLRIKVSAPPENGEANRAIVCLLAKTCKLTQNRIVLLKGETARQKQVLLMGYTALDFEKLGFTEK